MDLPQDLRSRLDAELAGANTADLRRAATRLSARYRGEISDGRIHLDAEADVLAYLAVRLPATYAATRAALGSLAEAREGFSPQTALDLGAGPGTGLWALADCWPELSRVTLIEQSDAARRRGERLAAGAKLPAAAWRTGEVMRALSPELASDIVLLGYVLGELSDAVRADLIARVWPLARDSLLIVEPGTSAGWTRILAVRAQLLALGAHVLAPCPHAFACPLAPPDWCHFAARISRSRLHRMLKEAELGWEDEKFIYLAASRHAPAGGSNRIIGRPQHGKGRVSLKLCTPDGRAVETMLSRRDGERYKSASRAEWGDAL